MNSKEKLFPDIKSEEKMSTDLLLCYTIPNEFKKFIENMFNEKNKWFLISYLVDEFLLKDYHDLAENHIKTLEDSWEEVVLNSKTRFAILDGFKKMSKKNLAKYLENDFINKSIDDNSFLLKLITIEIWEKIPKDIKNINNIIDVLEKIDMVLRIPFMHQEKINLWNNKKFLFDVSKDIIVDIFNSLYSSFKWNIESSDFWSIISTIEKSNIDVENILIGNKINQNNLKNELLKNRSIFNSRIYANEPIRKHCIDVIIVLVKLFLDIYNKEVIFQAKNWEKWNNLNLVINATKNSNDDRDKWWTEIKVDVYWIPINELDNLQNLNNDLGITINNWILTISVIDSGQLNVTNITDDPKTEYFQKHLIHRIKSLLKDLLEKNNIDIDVNFALFDH